MQRTWSADSISPSLERPAFDLTKPRKHGRRSSSHEQSANRDGVREWRRSRSLLNRGAQHNQSNSQSSASSLGSTLAPASTSTSVKRRSFTADSNSRSRTRPSKQRSLPAPLHADALLLLDRDDIVESESLTEREAAEDLSTAPYSSATYAAGPSGAGGTGYVSSSDQGNSSSEFEAFDWDTSNRRASRSLARDAHLIPPSSDQGSTPNGQAGGSLKVPSRATNGLLASPKRALFSLPSDTATPPNGRALHSETQAAASKSLLHSEKKASSPVSAGANEANAQSKRRARRRLRFNPSVEALMMVAAAGAAYYGLAHDSKPETRVHAFELGLLSATSTAYFFLRDPSEKGAIWATDHRNYRECPEDGALMALLLVPMLAVTSLFSALQRAQTFSGRKNSSSVQGLPNPPWLVEGIPPILHSRGHPPGDLTPLVLSLYSLVSLVCMTSTALLLHLLATKWIKRPHEFPKSNWKKLGSFTAFSIIVALLLEAGREGAIYYGLPLWNNLSRWEVITASLFFQANLYTISRLARKSFTLGELGMVATGGVVLTMETINLTVAKLLPMTTPYIKTFRVPTPLLIFQLALVVGTFMIGFLLSPLLYLSRNLAQKPTHRLRWPDKRDLHRRLLAGFFYLFASIFVFGVLGVWVRWMLIKRDPWLWTLSFLLKGQRPWSRVLLVSYWTVLVGASVSAWQAVVARAKRFRALGGSAYARPQGSTAKSTSVDASAGKKGKDGSEATKRTGAGSHANGTVSKDGSTVTIKKAAHLSLNARRKFFHALAVLLFVPGIALDPAFTHLAFSLAFSIFIFAEYVRYYALYPFGAALHVFMSEFTDHKDSGPVILSHFYLLTGCAAPLWLEGDSSIIHQTGVLVLGVGDALASVVGRRYGRVYWPGSCKTVEGSLAFFASITFSAWLLRLTGLCEHFSMWKYSGMVATLGLLEGVSDQNDNLVLPIFGLVVSSLVGL